MSKVKVEKLGGVPRAGVRAGAKKPGSVLTELQAGFCVNYVKQGCCNGAGAMEAAGSRGSYNSRAVQSSKYLKMPKIVSELKRLNVKADKRARNKEDKVVMGLAKRRARLSEIGMATSGDLRGISMENGRLIFDDEAVRSAVKAKAQVVVIPNPDHDPLDEESPKRVPAVVVDLGLHDPVKAIQELNKMDGVYKDGVVQPAEIHLHMGKGGLGHDAQTAAQLKDAGLRAPILGTKADAARFRKKAPAKKAAAKQKKRDPFDAVKKKKGRAATRAART